MGVARLVGVLFVAAGSLGCLVTADSSLWQRSGDGRSDAPPSRVDEIARDLPVVHEPTRDIVDLRPADARPRDARRPDYGLLTLDIPSVEDLSVTDGSPDANFGGDEDLSLGYCTGPANGNMRIWLKFDLSAVTAGATVLKANLRLYFFIHWGTQDYPVYRSSSDSWSEAAITWNTQPATDAAPLSTCPSFNLDNVWRSWDVTPATQQELAGDKKLTLVVKGATLYSPTSTPDHENYARSRRCSDPAQRPSLQLQLLTP